MIENLLLIATDLLKSLKLCNDFTEEERTYITSVAEKIISVAIFELNNKKVLEEIGAIIYDEVI